MSKRKRSKPAPQPLQPMDSAQAALLMRGPAPELKYERLLYRMLRRERRKVEQLTEALMQARERFATYKAKGLARGIARNLTKGLRHEHGN